MNEEPQQPAQEAVAIIGMAGRFPGAMDPDEFWNRLVEGTDCISRFGDDLEHSVATPEALAAGQRFVAARGTLAAADQFDAAFFGIYPREAELMDPQHRVFLECAWEALEHAGYEPAAFPGLIGVYAGLSLNTYLLWHLRGGSRLASQYQVGDYQTMLGNDKDFLPVRVSYKLNLRGPSMAVQTACSTSLVAICQAATALLAYQCDMALAGAASISFPQRRDYLYQEDGMVSPDGTCRAFDAAAGGTVFGHGCGVLLLKRLSEALADRDPILAVIKGWAVNNDGADKIGFAAPGLNAQAEVITLAQAAAGIDPASVSYIEAHGTGTPLGDPVEVAALTKAFRAGGATANGFCALGTGKTHIGHLDVAAGVTGVIKTIQQFRHNHIPALLHFAAPNPRIDFSNSPFFPVARPLDWQAGPRPRRAGVSAFGVGGTNAHVVLEEPPPATHAAPGRPAEPLLLAARSPAALDQLAARLAASLERPDAPPLADVAFTLAVGRRHFPWRRAVVAADHATAAAKLRAAATAVEAPAEPPGVVFLFPGQGSQYPEMGRTLYQDEPAFRAAVDECSRSLRPLLGIDLRAILLPDEDGRDEAARRLNETWLTQPCIFTVEYALARLWMSWGVRPALLIGHSIGEYVAAVLAGTFKLADALALLAMRARLMQRLSGGSMLAVRLGRAEVLECLPAGVELAAVNSPRLSTVSGPATAVAAFRAQLEARGVACRPLATSHAFHSAMMEPMVAPFAGEAAKVPAAAPSIPWISTCTGRLMDAATLADASYWARQLRQPVLFTEALDTAFAAGSPLVLLEVGPGQALAPFARQHPARGKSHVAASLPSAAHDLPDMLEAATELWKHGVPLDWTAFFAGQPRARVHLPTYPFERRRFWLDAADTPPALPAPAPPTMPTMPPTLDPAVPAPVAATVCIDRRADLTTRLRTLVLELSGVPVEDDSTTFTELGFDSLFLTQLSQALVNRHGVKVTFRQMLGDLASVAALARHLDEQLPADAAPAPPVVSAVAAPAPAAAPPSAGGDQLEQMIAGNLRLLETLVEQRRGGATPRLAPVRWPAGLPAPKPGGDHSGRRFGPYKPLEKGAAGELSPRQRQALDALVARYVARTARSKAYAAEHRAHFADPRAVAGFKSLWKEMVYPIVSAGSKGGRIRDLDGNDYVDITMGFGTYFFGHSPDWLVEALEAQLRTGIEIGPQSPLAGRLARAICDLTNLDRVTFCNTGSEAVMAAMRLARTVTGRDRIAYFTGDYHGMFEEVLVRGAWIDGVYRAQPIAPGIPSSLVENMLVLDYADPASLEVIKAHAHELAAVMVEPVQSRNPALQPREFIRELREITRRSDTALILDEVVTGFRCHPGGAQAYFGVEADLATYGKVLGGGMPIGVLAGRSRFMDALDGGAWNYGDDSFPEVGMTFFAGTFVRHPLALAAAARVVEHLLGEGPRLQIEMEERVGRLCRTLDAFCESAGVPVRLPHFSAHAVIKHAHDLPFASLLWYYLRDKGVHAWEGRPLYFTTAHTDEDLDHVVRAFTESVEEMQAAGFLPEPPAGPVARPAAFPRSDRAPTTEAQREIFHAVMMGPEANCSFNESSVIRFEGPLNLRAMRAALGDLIARHPALRSTFSADGASQFFHPAPRAATIAEHDLSAATPDEAAAALARLKAAESATPFDLTEGPLLRLHLVRLGADRHELVFTAHHMVCDGWSFGMLLLELAKAYNARRNGRLPMLPPAMPFAEFARTEAATRTSPEVLAAEQFWVSKFSNIPAALELPTDRPRPQLRSHAGAVEILTLDPARYARLKAVSPKLGGTIFSTLLACFATLLHRLTGQDDLVIGVPAAGQTRVGRDELVGHCLNFLPLRLPTPAAAPFRQFAAQVREQVVEAYDHQDYTWGSLLQKLTLPRDTSRPPLVSVMFNIDKAGIDQIRFDGLGFAVATNPKQFVNFELFFNLVQTDERMDVECEYNTDLHDPATIRRWLGCFEQLIDSVIADGDGQLAALPLLPPAEHRLLTQTWNATARDYPRDATLHSLVAEAAARNPAGTAVRCGDESLSYAALEQQATTVAARLQAAGVMPGDLVGIHLERSAELAAGLLGILKCGAAYVPLDPAFPAARLAMMVEDAGMKVILSQSALRAALPPSPAGVVLLDDPAPPAGGLLAIRPNPAAAAYVIFTSGSTGRPKGVRIPHRAVVNFLHSMRREPGLGPADVLLSVTTLSFDIAALEIFLPLTTGATTVIARRDETLDGRLLAELLDRHAVTVLQATPATWRLLLEAGWTGRPTLRGLVGGEAVPRELVNRLAPLCGELWNVYGPTETTIWSTTGRLAAAAGPVSIGRPIDNTQVYVVNDALQPQPPGVAGELLIGGDGLADGYHGLPDLTRERFIDSPFAAGARLYRTGDLARWQADGTLECLGRLDHQVKVRGFRIELGEVEAALESHPAVQQAVAHVHDGRLVACVKPRAEADDGTAIWRDQWDHLYQSAIEQAGPGGLDRLDAVVAGWAGASDVEAQVAEWIDTTVERLRDLGLGRVFEIGCGTGQLLSRLAPDCECYWAADISQVGIEALARSGVPANVRLFHRPADDFNGLPDAWFDTVIINSVAQYFPDPAYLRRVIEGAARMVRPGGRVFVGDVQGQALLTVQHAEAMRGRVPPETPAGRLRAMVESRVAGETELSADPAWFEWLAGELPAVAAVECRLRRGTLVNETTVYHYDVVLHVGTAPPRRPLPAPAEWRNLNLEQLEAILAERPETVWLTHIPDARLAAPLAFHRALHQTAADQPIPHAPAVHPLGATAEELFALAAHVGYRAHVRWMTDGTDGLLEAVFFRAPGPALPAWPSRAADDAPTRINTPHAAAPAAADLAPALRRHLAARLPDYMVPAAFVVVDQFPLTPNGKIDRRALPAPADAPAGPPRASAPPRNEAEARLLDIWRQVLRRTDIGVSDDIFELGGDSILIFQITTRANRAGLPVTPAQVFRLRTVAALAAEAAAPAAGAAGPAIQRVDRDAYRRKS